MESIQYFLHQQINKEKWDNCISNSANGLIYAKSFYLDAMAAGWSAIVLNDYEAVMPLTWKKKWGIAYLYQPAFIQQGGIFFKNPLADNTLQSFIELAFNKFKFAEITFNYLNNFPGLKSHQFSLRSNYVLPLTKTYNQIYQAYHSSVIKNLKRTEKMELQYSSSEDYTSILKLYEALYAERLPYFSIADFKNFGIICRHLKKNNALIIKNVTAGNGELLAAIILLKDGNRLYNVISCTTVAGRKIGANHFLYDRIISEFCNSNYLLDFEGSDVAGIADFYRYFGAANEQYPFVKINNLPALIKLFKR